MQEDAIYSILIQQSSKSDMHFDDKVYKDLFAKLSDDGIDYLYFDQIISILFLFFLSKLCYEVEHRNKIYQNFLTQRLLDSFVKQGVNPDNLNEKVITFKMAEKVIIDQRNYIAKDNFRLIGI